MKIPFLNIWVERKDYKDEYRRCDRKVEEFCEIIHNLYSEYSTLKQELSKYKTPRGKDGKFKSKKDKMTKQLKAEVDDLRKAGM